MANAERWRRRVERMLLQGKTEHHHRMFEEIIFLFYIYDLTVCGHPQLGTRTPGMGSPVPCSPLHRLF